MRDSIRLRLKSILAGVVALGMLCGESAMAQTHSGGGHVGGAPGGHYYGHPGYYGWGGGWRGGYPGWGWHGGWGWGWGWGWGGWGLAWGGLALGLYFASLPPYYYTYWWGGIPYYYANYTYYVYDGATGQYVTVAPPPELQQQVASQGPPGGPVRTGTDVIAYPMNGQSEEQQGKDKFECHQWAVKQTGFDPTQGASAAATPEKRGDYMRAQAACLEGRGYSVK